jgi:hypothetical protein
MPKHSLYRSHIIEVKPLGYSEQGNQRYEVSAYDNGGVIHKRKTRKNSSTNYDAKTLHSGDVADLITDGRGSLICIRKEA